MSKALIVNVVETPSELRVLLKKSIPFLQPRVKFLILLKRYSGKAVSKRTLMDESGLCSYSVHKWRNLYFTEGINALLKHNKVGFKPSKINEDEHALLKAKLHNPENGLRGYKELQEWVKLELKNDISYNTLLKYCVKNFGSKVKVARKYHAKKDEESVIRFKKISPNSAKKK
jgi:hypothetical protein